MNPGDDLRLRLQFLVRVVQRECRHLETTDQRLFEQPFSHALQAGHENVPMLIEASRALCHEIDKRGWLEGDVLA